MRIKYSLINPVPKRYASRESYESGIALKLHPIKQTKLRYFFQLSNDGIGLLWTNYITQQLLGTALEPLKRNHATAFVGI